MSLTRSVAHNSLIQIISKIVSVLLGLAVIPLMIRSLGEDRFGWYVTATAFLQFVGVLTDFGFTVVTSNMLAEPRYDRYQVLNTAFSWRFITGLIANVIAPAAILFFPYPAPVKYAVAILSLSFFAISLNQVFIGYYREQLRLWVSSLAEVGSRIILLVGIWLCAHGNWGFLPMMGAITLASVIGAAYQWWNIPSIRFHIDWDISASLFHKLWPTALSVIFNALYLQADRVILPLYAPAAIVGYYGTAYRVLDIVIQIAALLMGIVMPLITYAWSRGDRVEFKKRYQLGFDLIVLVLLPMIVGAALLADPIMRFVGVEHYEIAGTMLRWLSVSICGTCFGMIFGHIALAINRQKETLWIYASDALFSLLGYFVFIPIYGWRGAVGVTLFSELYAGVLLTISTIYYSRTFPSVKNFFKIAISATIMGVVIFYAPHWSVLLLIPLGAGVYALLVVALRVLSIDTIRDVISRRSELPVAQREQI